MYNSVVLCRQGTLKLSTKSIFSEYLAGTSAWQITYPSPFPEYIHKYLCIIATNRYLVFYKLQGHESPLKMRRIWVSGLEYLHGCGYGFKWKRNREEYTLVNVLHNVFKGVAMLCCQLAIDLHLISPFYTAGSERLHRL